jgi:hypothetical protein
MPRLFGASNLQDDGTLTVPQDAVEALGIHPGDPAQVRVESATDHGDRINPTSLSRAKSSMTRRTPEQIAKAQARATELYVPMRPVPPGKTLAEVVVGQWPGDETDEQIEAALRELS